jgi:isoleucyl-tRNA synthetase
MPFAQYGWPHVAGSDAKLHDQFPANYICEGLDQTRGWFYTLHAIGAFATTLEDAKLPQGPAYKTCLVNGLVLDKDGVKMSKRLGNIVDPWKVIEQHGADAARWYLAASAAPWLPKRFDPKGIEDVRRGLFSTLVNSYQFFREYARIDGFEPNSPGIPPVSKRSEIDRWLVSRTHTVAGVARAKFADYDLTAAARAIETFVVDELSNWYIRRNRRRFWKGETGADKLAAFASLHTALRTVALAMAPLAPFLSEMLWQRLAPGAGSVHAQMFPQPIAGELAPELEGSMELVERIVVMGRALREKAGIKVRQPLRSIHVRASDARALELLATPFATAQVLDELNIKAWGTLGADDGQLCRLTGKANFRVLGKKLGPRMKTAAAAIEKLDGASLARLRAGGSSAIDVDGEQVELTPEDVLVQVETTASFPVETDGRFVVWLDTELDPGLIDEGLAREVIIRVNALRKESRLAVEQRIALTLAPESDTLAAALQRHRDMIASETLARALTIVAASELPLEREGVARWDLGAGQHLRCALSAV